MALITRVEQKVRLDKNELIKFQFLTYCFLKKIPVAEGELDCLTMLSIGGEQELNSFCDNASGAKVYASAQTVRNALIKLEQKGLINKSGKHKKKIWVNTDIKIESTGNILLDLKFLSVNETGQV